MPLSFPSSPSVGQQATTGNRTYQWTGESWQIVGSGIAGPTGATGPAGSGIALKGSVSTVGNLPSSGNTAGDSYVVNADGNLYVWSGSSWSSAGQIVGPTGPAGQSVTGPSGAAGAAGATGPTGPAGSGSSFSWASVPSTSTSSGVAGQIAYDADRIYVCTATGTWRASALSRWDGDPYFSSVSLLMRANGSNGSTSFTDSSKTGMTLTASGNAQVSTSQAKWGESLALDGSGDYLTASNYGDAFDFTGDFTVEAWVYITATATYHAILEGRTSSGGFANFVFGLYNVSGTLRLDHVNFGGSGARFTGTSTSVSLNTWTHVAIVRSGGVIRGYVGGTRDSASVTYSSSITPAGSSVLIGSVVDPAYFNGYIDDLRVTKAARYSGSTITVPAEEFKDY